VNLEPDRSQSFRCSCVHHADKPEAAVPEIQAHRSQGRPGPEVDREDVVPGYDAPTPRSHKPGEIRSEPQDVRREVEASAPTLPDQPPKVPVETRNELGVMHSDPHTLLVAGHTPNSAQGPGPTTPRSCFGRQQIAIDSAQRHVWIICPHLGIMTVWLRARD
jgi:hypothetical protein